LGVELPSELSNEPPTKKQRRQSPDLPPEAAAYRKRLGEELDSLIEDIKKDRQKLQNFCKEQKKKEEEIKKIKEWKGELSTRIGRKQKEIDQKKSLLRDIVKSHKK
jgi:DNA repair exonuclease SbcCD ATPase subunit